MAGAGRLAAGSGSAFAVGTVAGVVGNNLAHGVWFWIGFAVLTVGGALLSAWLTYRAATNSGPVTRHVGDNKIGNVRGEGSGPTVGVNYGEAHGSGSDQRAP
jgi:hypothetical protein